MTREQWKHMKQRLLEINQLKRNATFEPEPMPKSIAAAKRAVDAWAAKQRLIMAVRRARLEKAYAQAYQAMLFREPPDVLKALRKFEAFKP